MTGTVHEPNAAYI